MIASKVNASFVSRMKRTYVFAITIVLVIVLLLFHDPYLFLHIKVELNTHHWNGWDSVEKLFIL